MKAPCAACADSVQVPNESRYNWIMMDAKQLAKHVAKKWEAITGLPKSAMHDEGEFPEEVENLCTASTSLPSRKPSTPTSKDPDT